MFSCRRSRRAGFSASKRYLLCEMEINAGVAGSLSRIAVDSPWPIVWESVPIVVKSGGDVVRHAGILPDNASEPEASRQTISANDVESVATVIVSPPEFWTQIIIVGRQGKHSTGIVQGFCERVLSQEVHSLSYCSLKRDCHTVAPPPPRRFKLVDVDETWIRWGTGPRQRRVDVSRAVKLYSPHHGVIDREIVCAFTQLSFDGKARLCQVGGADTRRNSQQGWRRWYSRIIGHWVSWISYDYLGALGPIIKQGLLS